MCACCPHGVVYAVKFLLRGESPRDHVDIYCYPSMHNRHCGFVISQDLWQIMEIKGKKICSNPIRVDLLRKQKAIYHIVAKAGQLKVAMAELDLSQMIFVPCPYDVDHSYSALKHPLTKSAEHFCG